MIDREHILSEIRRTARENDGEPLGRQRFFAETGIKSHDWLGKYWARWCDTLAEAGFSPNKLQVAYDENFLLEKLVASSRELGHVPVFAELNLKAASDPTFPSGKTFAARFGTKSNLVTRLAKFCEQHGHSDVLVLCSSKPLEVRKREKSPSSEASFGFVYLLRYGHHYKIGRSNSVGRRERELAIQLPERAKLVHSIKTDDPDGIEHYWHQRFESKRRNGEWFELTTADVAIFRRRKFM